MTKWKVAVLAVLAITGLVLGGCGDDNTTVVIVKPSGKYLYVNNDAGENYVSAFAIKRDGTLQELTGSPYITGGTGTGGGYFASNAIALARDKRLLFVANKGDSTISVFRASSLSGKLTAIGTPVASGGTLGGSGSLAVNDAETLLFAANDTSSSISVFGIAKDGTLTPVAGSPFDIGIAPDGISMNLVGSTLYAAAPNSNQLAVLAVADDGSLSHIAGSPFANPAAGNIASFVLGSATVGVSGATGGTIASYLIDATGAPTYVGSLNVGVNAQCVAVARNGELAMLTGGQTSQISVFQLAADGTLAAVTGSPFATSAPVTGYVAANPKGTFLYATEQTQIEAFAMDAAGALTSIGTYTLTNPGYATALVVY